ncbi:MAG: GtrA family protein [Lachnospiraceae bacterium]
MRKVFVQFLKFGMVGAINTLLSLAIYWFCIWLSMFNLVANAIAFVITVFVSYILNNLLTFRNGEQINWSVYTLAKVYISYSFTGLFLNSLLLYIWTSLVGIGDVIAPILNLFVTIPINFVLNKLWAYKKDRHK